MVALALLAYQFGVPGHLQEPSLLRLHANPARGRGGTPLPLLGQRDAPRSEDVFQPTEFQELLG